MAKALIPAVLVLAVSTSALANESFAERGIGGLSIGKNDKVAIDAAKVFLSGTLVQVEYEFLSRSTRDEAVAISFPLPRVPVCATCDAEDVLGLTFETWIDGVKAPPTRSAERIVLGDKDVSALLKKHGLTRVQEPEKVAKLKPAAKKELQKAGLIAGAIDSDRPELRWEVEKVFFWDQTLKAGQRLSVKHAYAPITGVAKGVPLTEGGFCIDDETRAAMEKKDKKREAGQHAGGYSWIRYILKAPAPIRAFELTIQKKDTGQLVSTCFKGLEKKDGRSLSAKLTDFVPTEDVTVLFF